jgi:hypothetical protein
MSPKVRSAGPVLDAEVEDLTECDDIGGSDVVGTRAKIREQAVEVLRKLLGEHWQESTLEQVDQAVTQTGSGAQPEWRHMLGVVN